MFYSSNLHKLAKDYLHNYALAADGSVALFI